MRRRGFNRHYKLLLPKHRTACLEEPPLLIVLRRCSSSKSTANPSWLRALTDPQIGEALRQMHAEPGRPWTVAGLARTVSMSRSAFADRFRELVGETPLDHLTRWRMVRAANMMRANRPMKLAAIASAVGYESESSFGKTFRRVMGISPGKYRLTKRTDQSEALPEMAFSGEV